MQIKNLTKSRKVKREEVEFHEESDRLTRECEVIETVVFKYWYHREITSWFWKYMEYNLQGYRRKLDVIILKESRLACSNIEREFGCRKIDVRV